MFRSCLLGELYENLSMETNKYLRGPRYIQLGTAIMMLFLESDRGSRVYRRKK